MRPISDRDWQIGQMILERTRHPRVAEQLRAALAEAKAKLHNDPAMGAAAVPIHATLFDDRLPAEIASCRLSVMRAHTACPVERHPNARQYVLSLEESGAIRLIDDSGADSSELCSDPSAPLSARWHLVPANTWHQPIPGKKDWAVLAFHSVPAQELLDEFAPRG
jgi:hypothetical protein